MKELLKLYLTFFKIGLFTLGGGTVVISTVSKEAESRGWMSNEEFLDCLGIINCVPGPISTNLSTFVGYKVKKTAGAFFALAGVVSPSIIIVMAISMLYQSFSDALVVQSFFNGILPGVVAVVLLAVLQLAKAAKITQYFNWIFSVFAFLAIAIFGMHPFIVVVIAALYGLIARNYVVNAIDNRKKKGENNVNVD